MKDIKYNKINNIEFGNTARDKLLRITLENKVAANIKFSLEEVVTPEGEILKNVLHTELYNLNEEKIASDSFDLDINHIIRHIELDLQEKRLLFTLAGGDTIYCSIADLIDDYSTKIELETQRAITAEDALQASIEAEAHRASGSEASIVAEIVAESSARQTADQNLLDTLTAETTARTSEITRLDGLISDEETRAKGAEQTLTTDLASEAAIREQADYSLTQNIIAEVDRATGVENNLNTSLDNEITRATGKEAELTIAISNEATARYTADSNLDDAINTEKLRAKAEEARIEDKEDTAIAAEQSRAKDAEATLDGRIGTEVTARGQADSNLHTAITNETSVRTSEITRVEALISAEATDRDTADQNLLDTLTAETTARTSEITRLDGLISDEETRAKEAEATLDGRIGTEVTARGQADSNLQEQITNITTLGRFLSTWDCTTGLPETNPPGEAPYSYGYKTGDYFVISHVNETSTASPNYCPSGTTYTGEASTEIETALPKANDYYRYDGNDGWILVVTDVRTYTWDEIANKPTTRDGYALSDVYTMAEIDTKDQNILVAAKQYTDDNGGKIDKIFIGEVEQTINEKKVTLPVYPTISSLGFSVKDVIL